MTIDQDIVEFRREGKLKNSLSVNDNGNVFTVHSNNDTIVLYAHDGVDDVEELMCPGDIYVRVDRFTAVVGGLGL